MEALQFNVSMPQAGKVLGTIYEPLYWGGLSCLRYGKRCRAGLPLQRLAHRFWRYKASKAVFVFERA